MKFAARSPPLISHVRHNHHITLVHIVTIGTLLAIGSGILRQSGHLMYFVLHEKQKSRGCVGWCGRLCILDTLTSPYILNHFMSSFHHCRETYLNSLISITDQWRCSFLKNCVCYDFLCKQSHFNVLHYVLHRPKFIISTGLQDAFCSLAG